MSSEERRMGRDQQWYTWHEFQDFYGIDPAARLWEAARRKDAKVDVAKDPPPQPQVSNASAAQPARLPPPQHVAKEPPPQPQVSNAANQHDAIEIQARHQTCHEVTLGVSLEGLNLQC